VTFQEGHYLIGLAVAALALVWGMVHLLHRASLLTAFTRLHRRLNNERAPWLHVVLLSSALALISLALAGPAGEGEGYEARTDLLFVLDTSRSMLAVDGEVSRLDQAKQEIRSLLKRPVGRAGLIAFAGQARMVCPLTRDLESLERLLDPLDSYTVPAGGTSLRAGLEQAAGAFDDEERVKVAVLLSDGEDLGNPSYAQAARNFGKGIRLHTVLVGDPSGAKIPEPDGGGFVKDPEGRDVVSRPKPWVMSRLASDGGGSFMRAFETAFALDFLYTRHVEGLKGTGLLAGAFQGLLLLALLLIVLDLFFPLRSKAALLCVPILLSFGTDSADLVRQGVAQYDARNHAGALELFEQALEQGETPAAPAARFGAGLACFRLAEAGEAEAWARAAAGYFERCVADGVWPEDARINLELAQRFLETEGSGSGEEPGEEGASQGEGTGAGGGDEAGGDGQALPLESKQEIFAKLEEMERKRIDLEREQVKAMRSREGGRDW
jgi:Ca-activated chloride channel family protein